MARGGGGGGRREITMPARLPAPGTKAPERPRARAPDPRARLLLQPHPGRRREPLDERASVVLLQSGDRLTGGATAASIAAAQARLSSALVEQKLAQDAYDKVTECVKINGNEVCPGLGTPEEQARLFTPFTRLDQVSVKGHGLGLSITRRIAEKLDGQVGVESEVGQGSTFWFTLPVS